MENQQYGWNILKFLMAVFLPPILFYVLNEFFFHISPEFTESVITFLSMAFGFRVAFQNSTEQTTKSEKLSWLFFPRSIREKANLFLIFSIALIATNLIRFIL